MRTIKLIPPLLFAENHLQISRLSIFKTSLTTCSIQKIETSPHPRRFGHAHHTVTVRDWFHLYLHYSISEMLMSIGASR